MDHMDLSVILAVHEEGRLSDAALRLFVSQPAITYRLRKIERELQATIFRQTRQGVVMTAEGEPVVDYARKVLALREDLSTAMYRVQGQVAGTLRIASSFNFAHFQLPQLLGVYSKKFPQVTIQLDTGFSQDVVKSLYNEQTDIAISSGGPIWDDVRMTLARERIVLISREPVSLDELPSVPLVDYSANPHLRKRIKSWWRDNFEADPEFRMKVGYTDTCREMVLQGIGAAIVPEFCVRPGDDLFVQELADAKGILSRDVVLDCRERDLENTVLSSFIETVTSELSHLSGNDLQPGSYLQQ